MGITLFVVASAAALCAAAVMLGSRVIPVQEPEVAAQDTGAGLECSETLAIGTAREWHVTSLKNLSEVEDLLDCLESQGYAEREVIVQGNDSFAVRWR
jgi:hypothetical protein